MATCARACEALPGHALGFLLTRFYRLADQARRPAALELSRLPQSTGKGRQHTLSSPDVHICAHFPAGSCHADHPWTSSLLSLLTPRSAPTCPCSLTPEPAQGAVEPCSRTRPTATAPSPTSPSDHKASSCWQPPAAARHLPLQAQQEGKEGLHHPWAQQRDDILFFRERGFRRGCSG